MSHIVKKDYGDHISTPQKLQDLIDASTITTLHTATIIKIGADFYMALLVYEGS